MTQGSRTSKDPLEFLSAEDDHDPDRVYEVLVERGALRPGVHVLGDPSMPDPFVRATAHLCEGLLLGPSHTGDARPAVRPRSALARLERP